jgi:hypothetical protein
MCSPGVDLIHRVSDTLLGGGALDLHTRAGAVAARLKADQILGELGLHRDQREAIERGLADVLVGAVEQGLDHHTHAADANEVTVVGRIRSRSQVMQKRRVLVGTLAAQDADLRLSEGIELRREGIPDLCDADLLVGQSARSIELRQVSRHQASAVVDVVLDEGSGLRV